MTTSKRAINRIGISELPSAVSIDSTDYLILQSDGVSSKIQISDVKLNRENITFYNEIVSVNILTETNSRSISTIRDDISVLQDTIGINTADTTDSTNITTLGKNITTIKNDLGVTNKNLVKLTTRVTTSEGLIGINQSDVLTIIGTLESSVADISDRLLDVETALALPAVPTAEGLSIDNTRVSRLEKAVKKILAANSGIVSFDWSTGS